MRIPIRKESLPFIAIFLLLSAVFYIISPVISMIFLAFLLLIIYFFRDPERVIPQSDELIISPADGHVSGVHEISEDKFINDKANKISIFLSVFDVHITRSPVEGEINFIKCKQGKFLPAFLKEASSDNTSTSVAIESKYGKVFVKQIAGLIARKIISFVSEKEKLQKGQKLGLIMFGSCTEVILPATAEIIIRKGQKVKAGETVLAKWSNNEK